MSRDRLATVVLVAIAASGWFAALGPVDGLAMAVAAEPIVPQSATTADGTMVHSGITGPATLPLRWSVTYARYSILDDCGTVVTLRNNAPSRFRAFASSTF